MKVSLETVRAVTEGAEHVEEENGAFRFYRFTEEEMRTNKNPNRTYAAGVALSFRTNADGLSLSLHAESLTGSRSYFTLEVLVDGRRVGTIQNFDGESMTGNYADKVYPLGDFSGEFSLGTGEKTVKILFPHSVYVTLSHFALSGADFVTPVAKRPPLIAYGDSITQGYDALCPSETYAYRIAEALGLSLVNKGLGGATFMPTLAVAENGRRDGVLLVAYGTNDWRHCSAESLRKNATAFLDALVCHYPASDIFVLSPIDRGDSGDVTVFGAFSLVSRILAELCEGREHVHFIEGIDLLPYDERLFGDLRLHPSGEGFALYATNLLRKMQKSRI